MNNIRLDTKRLDEIIAKMPGRAEKIISSTAFQIEGQAKMLSPIKTGFLRNSIMAEPERTFTWRVNVGAEYGIYQELGTSRMAAHPFLVPAVEKFRAHFYRQFEELFK